MLWLTAIAVVIYGLHWPQVVRYNWGLDRAILIRDTVILAPVWIPLLFSWAAFYEVENATRQSRSDHVPALAPEPAAPAPRARFVWLVHDTTSVSACSPSWCCWHSRISSRGSPPTGKKAASAGSCICFP